MEDTTIAVSRLRNKKKWAYSFHSKLSLQTEEYLKITRFQILKLGKLVAEISDGLHSTRHYVDDGIVMLAVRNITEFGLDLSSKKMITQAEHEHLKRSQVQPGDLLVTITGRLGTALVYTSEKPANLSAHVARVKVHVNKVNPYYLAAYLNSNFGKQLLNEYSIGSLYPHINVNGLQNVQIILPPKPIQDCIAQIMQNAYVTKNDKLIKANQILEGIDVFILEKLDIKLEKIIYKNHFLVTVSKFLGRRFDVESISTEFNPSDYPNSSWLSLNEVTTLPSSTKIPSRKPNEEYLYMGMTDVDEIFGEVNINNLLGKDIKANKAVIKGNDVVFARIEPCMYNRKIALIPSDIKEALGSTELLIARAKSNILPSFLLWLLRSELIQRQIAGKMTGTTGRRRLPDEVFASLKLPKISLELQKLIADQATQQRDEAKRLYSEAEDLLTEAKARVERMILGEEDVT